MYAVSIIFICVYKVQSRKKKILEKFLYSRCIANKGKLDEIVNYIKNSRQKCIASV